MNYQRPELIERLAGEYVLGTLRGRARKRFEALIGAYLPARRAVYWWEERLARIAMELPEVAPPPHVWPRIARRIAPQPATRQPKPAATRLWQALAACFALIAVGLVSYVGLKEPEVRVRVQIQPQPLQPTQVAIVADATAPLWVVNAFPENGELQVRALRAIAAPTDRVFELWMLPTSGAAPVSLGLLPVAGDVVLPLPAASAQILAASATVAVSVEPTGGSPTGAPTGPVVYTAPLVQVRG